MAFAQSQQARLPLVSVLTGNITTLQASLYAADCELVPPRFDADLSIYTGGFTIRDLGVSLNRTFIGWLSQACRSDYVISDLLVCRDIRPSCWTHWDHVPGSHAVGVLGGSVRVGDGMPYRGQSGVAGLVASTSNALTAQLLKARSAVLR